MLVIKTNRFILRFSPFAFCFIPRKSNALHNIFDSIVMRIT